jgi:hypothetical protein
MVTMNETLNADFQVTTLGPLVEKKIEHAGHDQEEEENRGKTAIGMSVPGQLSSPPRLADDSPTKIDTL